MAREGFMTELTPNASALVALLAFDGTASAQQAVPTRNPLDVIPEDAVQYALWRGDGRGRQTL
jgi:hypothetical protein